MRAETKTLLLAGFCGGVGGGCMTAFIDASRTNDYPLMLLFAVLYLAVCIMIWRVMCYYRKLKGWENS